ncbi:MAG: tRNA dihydrouridine synthase DusB [Chthoniobacterales bacterium]|nr:tRNA dihydrouridine synthase DusB [Chthoniobacterales bacterium]
MLPWFSNGKFPLYLAPMAGVSDMIFRQLCKERGADVLVTEFVSSEGVFRRNHRTRGYIEFGAMERPIGVQLFGGNAEHMGEAARQVVGWVQPDFIDLNFGCPVNKVVAKNGGSALLKDCPTLGKVAAAVVRAVAPLPVTAKIRTGWDEKTVNAVAVARQLESLGIAALAVHGRTRAQGYSGAADWDVIAEVAAAVSIPVIGNGDLFTAADIALRKRETGIAGAMIGRAAMSSPWIFSQTKHFLATGMLLPLPEPAEKWALIQRHCELAVAQCGRNAACKAGEAGLSIEDLAMRSMRGRLMAYSKGMPASKMLREKFQRVSSLGEVAEIARTHLATCLEAA